jgi:hypothetical protein
MPTYAVLPQDRDLSSWEDTRYQTYNYTGFSKSRRATEIHGIAFS